MLECFTDGSTINWYKQENDKYKRVLRGNLQTVSFPKMASIAVWNYKEVNLQTVHLLEGDLHNYLKDFEGNLQTVRFSQAGQES